MRSFRRWIAARYRRLRGVGTLSGMGNGRRNRTAISLIMTSSAGSISSTSAPTSMPKRVRDAMRDVRRIMSRTLLGIDVGAEVDAQEGPGCNARCEAHHVLVHVTHLPVTPGGQDLGGEVHHDLSVTGDLLAMESRLA